MLRNEFKFHQKWILEGKLILLNDFTYPCRSFYWNAFSWLYDRL